MRGEGIPLLLLTAEQAAQVCQVSKDMIYRWSYIPDFPAIAGQHQIRIHARLFDEWLARRARGRVKEEEEAVA